MLKNYLKIALRNLQKHKGYAFINVISLSIGMAVCILILLFVQYEKSFDAIHTKNIYRLNEVQRFPGMASQQNVALSMYPMAPTLQSEFPEIKNYVRINSNEMAGLTYNDKHFFLDNIFWTDASFFDMFEYKLLKGDRRTALTEPGSVVLTEETAEKIFGSEDPIGKSMSTYNSRDTLHFKVTAVMENTPDNSHLQFDALYALSTIIDPKDKDNWRAQWGGNWLITYLELADHADTKKLEAEFPAYLTKYLGEEGNKNYKLYLQSLKTVHSASGNVTHDYHNFKKFDAEYTRIFLIVAIIVLVIGCVNFVNLSTAKSSGRAKEVGVRKSVGALRFQVMSQFMSESVLLSAAAMLLAVLLVMLALPHVSLLSGHELNFSFIQQPFLLPLLIAGVLVIGFLSGIYPALYLSSFQPVKVLKGVSAKGRRSLLRNGLVVTQFACAAFLIIATVFVLKQLNFMRNKDAGFNKDQVIVISGAYKNYQKLKTALEANPMVKGVSGSSQSLGNNLHQTGFTYKGNGPARNLGTSHIFVDEDFIPLYQIKLLAGRNFTKEGNGKEYIVNESMARELLKDEPKAGYETLIGQRIQSNYSQGDTMTTIVGVVKDFNFNSLHNKIETLCLVNYSSWGFHDISVKIDGRHAKEAIEAVGKLYGENIKTFPFSYFFLDKHFEKLYANDQRVSKVVGILGGFAILIACLGLLGLASYATETRIKEIGVRKVLGATVSDIVSLLSKDFVKLVLLANIIAWPLAWYLMNRWLENYAYHIHLSWWVFGLAGISSLLIALISVSSQTFKAAVSNPVNSLRTE